MRILIVNDDGARSIGMFALIEAFKDEHELTVVVPREQHSGASHSMSFFLPLTAEQVHLDALDHDIWMVGGTPADCSVWALDQLFTTPPDLVISGINMGFNTGDCAYCSGTIGAAYEAAGRGIPSIAISGPFETLGYDYRIAARVLRKLLPDIMAANAGKPMFYSINVPECAEDEIRGVIAADFSMDKWTPVYEKRRSPRGFDYYWHADFGGYETPQAPEGTDSWALANNYVSITPIKVDYVDHEALAAMPDFSASLKKER